MEDDKKMGVYEIGYLFVPTIAEENVGGEVTRLKDSLAKHGSVFISDEYPKSMDLAYQMSRTIANKKAKFDQGYFGWIKFEMPVDEALKLKAVLDMDESLIRYLLIKTVKENTMSIKRTYTKTDSKKKNFSGSKTDEKEEGEGEKEIIDEETIDEDIEALVVE